MIHPTDGDLAKRIREAPLNVAEIARRAGLCYATVSAIANRRVVWGRADTRERIEAVLDEHEKATSSAAR